MAGHGYLRDSRATAAGERSLVRSSPATVVDDRADPSGAGLEEIERHRADVTAGPLYLASPPMTSAWGRRA